MSKAIIYVRVSSTTEDKQTNDRQIEELKNKAILDGYADKDIIIYADKISGFVKGDHRPSFSELLSAIRNDSKLYSMIYIHEISRLGRNPDHVQLLLSEISQLGIPIFIKSINLYTMTNGARNSFTNIIISILSEFAHQEVEYTKLRVISGLKSSAHKGRVGGGIVYPYGFKNDNQMLVVDEEEASIIKKIFELYQEGNGSKQICNYLNNNNVPTRLNKALQGKTIKLPSSEKNASDIRWSDTQIISILRNSIYKGERKFKGELIPIQPIISKDVFDDCTRIRKTKVSRDYDIKYDYLLKDLLKCGCCGRTYFAKYKPVPHGDKVYICSSRLKLKGSCGNVGVNISYLESVVYDALISSGALADRIKNKDELILSVQRKLEKLSNDLITAQFELSSNKLSLSKLDDGYYIKHTIDQSRYETLSLKVTCTIDDLISVLASIEADIVSSKKLLKKLQSTTSSEKFFANLKTERKQIIQIFKEYIDRIIITKLDNIYVMANIYLSIDGSVTQESIKIFLDLRLPRKKNMVMTYGFAGRMSDEMKFDNNILLSDKVEIVKHCYENHSVSMYNEKTGAYNLINRVIDYTVPKDNIFSLPITFKKDNK